MSDLVLGDHRRRATLGSADAAYHGQGMVHSFSESGGAPCGLPLSERPYGPPLFSEKPLAQAAVPEMAIVDRSARKCPGNLATVAASMKPVACNHYKS